MRRSIKTLILLILAAWGLQERVKSAWVWGVVAGLLVGWVSGLPWYIPLISYLAVVALTQAFRRRVWQAPLLAMFTVCLLGTVILQGLSYVSLRFLGDPLPLGESLSLIMLPSVLLNMMLEILIHPLVRDLARWIHPAEAQE